MYGQMIQDTWTSPDTFPTAEVALEFAYESMMELSGQGYNVIGYDAYEDRPGTNSWRAYVFFERRLREGEALAEKKTPWWHYALPIAAGIGIVGLVGYAIYESKPKTLAMKKGK